MSRPVSTQRRTPPPRPALRKAGDAHLHPAAGIAAPAPAPPAPLVTVPPIPATEPEPARKGSRPAVPPVTLPSSQDGGKAGTALATDGPLRASDAPPSEPEPPAPQPPAPQPPDTEPDPAPKAKKPKRPKADDPVVRPFHGSTSDTIRRHKPAGKKVDLDVQVPKPLRKAAREKADRIGLSLDTVVTDLLTVWID